MNLNYGDYIVDGFELLVQFLRHTEQALCEVAFFFLFAERFSQSSH